MRRDNDFEKAKITKASTDKVVTNVYMDAFPIEKVRFQNANYETKESISVYVDFPIISRLAADIIGGRLSKMIENSEYHRYTVCMGGSAKSDKYDGAPEYRNMQLGTTGNMIFVNMSSGKGKLSKTGAIMPDGKPDVKISVGMSVEDFKSMILYTHDCICAYLTPMIGRLVKEIEEDRKNKTNNN